LLFYFVLFSIQFVIEFNIFILTKPYVFLFKSTLLGVVFLLNSRCNAAV